MAHMRKMALVDPRLLETLRTPIQPPIDTNLRDLDSEMTSILDKTDIDVSEKVRLYNQALLRYNDMAKMSATKPTPVVVVKEKETPPTTDIMGEVVTTLPKALQEKGRQLVSRLKTTQWNDRHFRIAKARDKASKDFSHMKQIKNEHSYWFTGFNVFNIMSMSWLDRSQVVTQIFVDNIVVNYFVFCTVVASVYKMLGVIIA